MLPLLPCALTLALAAPPRAGEAFRILEQHSGGRLGVAVLDAQGKPRLVHRGGERFPFCSTVKVLIAGAVLAQADAGTLRLEERVAFGAEDLLAHAPVCRGRLAQGGMSLAELCEAALGVSDNTAANLLLARLGGPAAVTAFARAIGDGETRLDRREPELNEARPGDPRDTTTPEAMAATLRRLLEGPALRKASRARLAAWMAASTTGARRLRAGFPSGWGVKDRSGSGDQGTTNDIAVVTVPDGTPLYVAVYLTGARVDAAARERVIAGAGRIVAAWWRMEGAEGPAPR